MPAFPRPVAKDITKLFRDAFDAGTAEVNKQDEQKRDNKFFHISSVGYCMKSVYLDRIHGKEQELGFLRKVNFGTAIHELYQKYLAYSGKLYGMYYCKKCKGIFGPQYASACESCGGDKLMEYSELHLINSALKVSGHPDLFVKLNGKIYLGEIKTISGYYKIGAGVEQIGKYVPEHKHQCNFYLGVMHHKSTLFKETDKAVFVASMVPDKYLLVYHDKGSDEMIPYEVDYSESMFQDDLKRVAEFHACVKAEKEPEGEPHLRKCKYCAYINKCAGME